MVIKYDRDLSIATGQSRKTKTWKNQTVSWSRLLDKLSKTTVTPETVAEYKAMGREKQSDIKDVGGFVGGYCKNGRRTDVTMRSMLCLDADFAKPDFWDTYTLMIGNAGAIYSTHKHTSGKPRLRLVIPLNRDVDPDEYQAIGRRVAQMIDIEQFDDTSYQPQRMMYWPSTSKDGEYIFESIDAPLMDVDQMLATYRDWRDISSWPTSSRVAGAVEKTAAKQKDPLEKQGIVGAFCRAYTIQEAIEAFIPDYVPCDIPNRYTYSKGSTAAGVVLYDNKFSYSNHATDPASSQLCNAFDLVRLHKFHELDKDCPLDQGATSRPSYKAMAQFAADDVKVKAQIVSDLTKDAKEDFKDDVTDENWTSLLKVTEKGGIVSCIENVVIILQHDTELVDRLAYNEMSHSVVTRQSLPWRKVNGESGWTDADDSALRYYLERKYSISSKDKIFDAVNVVAQEHTYHPVREYLNTCAWDGIPRVDTLLIDYLGAEDTPYTRAVTRKTLAAAVARVYRPGCKFDYMLTLRGGQGIGKSTLIAMLGGDWFSDTFTTMQGKDAYEQVQGVWIMEVGELAGMKKAEAETIKLYISKQGDRFRPAYGRRTREFPRQCIFIATTNETQFLRDTTGNRRFWVVDTPNPRTKEPWNLTKEDVSKIWGEAVEIFQKGEDLFLSREDEETARDIQSAYEEENPRTGIVADYLERLLPPDWKDKDLFERRLWLESPNEGTERRETVSTIEIWSEALNMNPERLDRFGIKDIRDIMAGFPEWHRQKHLTITTKPYGRQKYYRRY